MGPINNAFVIFRSQRSLKPCRCTTCDAPSQPDIEEVGEMCVWNAVVVRWVSKPVTRRLIGQRMVASIGQLNLSAYADGLSFVFCNPNNPINVRGGITSQINFRKVPNHRHACVPNV